MAIEDRDNLGLIDGQTIYNARIQSLSKATIRNGVVGSGVANTSLKVTEREAGANMSVDVQLGKCIINGTTHTEAADVNIVIAAAHATDERIDLIVYDQSAGNPAVVAGTPHATHPQVPDVTDDNDIPLGLVYVLPQDGVGYTGTIVTAYITDIRSYIYQVESGKYTMVGAWLMPIQRSLDDNEGSCFLVNGTTYGYCGYSRCVLPTIFPTGTTLVAKFFAILAEGSNTSYVKLYNDTDAVDVTELTGSGASAIPYMVVSAELSTGAGNDLVTNKNYVVLIKNSNAGADTVIYSAWVEFYSKTP